MESCIARPLLICANLLKIPHITKRSTKMYARLRCGGNLPLCLTFGTGEGYLWYGTCVPCSKRLPGVRDAFFGSVRCKKQASTVRKRYSVPKTASSGTRRIFKGAQNSLLPHRTHLQCAKRPRSEVIRHKKRVTSASMVPDFAPVELFT